MSDTPREFGTTAPRVGDAFPDLSAELGAGDVTDLDAEASDLDVIEAELKAKVAGEVTLPIDGREGWSARFRTDFTSEHIDGWRKQARARKFVDGIDGAKFAALLVGSTMTALIRRGELLELDGTSPITVTSKPLQALLETSGALETVRALYGSDGRLDGVARGLMREAGYGDEVLAQDPQ